MSKPKLPYYDSKQRKDVFGNLEVGDCIYEITRAWGLVHMYKTKVVKITPTGKKRLDNGVLLNGSLPLGYYKTTKDVMDFVAYELLLRKLKKSCEAIARGKVKEESSIDTLNEALKVLNEIVEE